MNGNILLSRGYTTRANPGTGAGRDHESVTCRRFVSSLFAFVLTILVSGGVPWASMVTVVPGDFTYTPISPAISAGDAYVLAFGDEKVFVHEEPLGLPGELMIRGNVSRDKLYIVRDKRARSERTGYEVLYSHKAFKLAVVEHPETLQGIGHLLLKPVTRSMTVTEKVTFSSKAPNPLIESILDKLSLTSYESYLSALSESLSTRYYCSVEAATARAAISKHFRTLGLDTHVVKFNGACWPKACAAPQAYNVIGIKRGKTYPNIFCLVGAHYDSINENNPCGRAPGANDNASGVAGVMELARLFTELETDRTVVFVAFGGEEQDLYGSKAFVRSLYRSPPFANLRPTNLKSFVVLDEISWWESTYGVFLEGASHNIKQRAALNRLANAAWTYTDLEVEKTFNYWGSDHEPFLDKGLPGALAIETDSEDYPYYHAAGDVFDEQDTSFAMEVLNMTAALLAADTGARFPKE